MDKLEESLHYLYEALKIRRTLLGDNNPDVCDTLSIIACILTKKDLEKSLTLFRVVLNIKLKQCKMTNAYECEDLLKAYLDVLGAAKQKLRVDNHNEDLHDEISMLFFSIGNVYEKLHLYKIAIGYYNRSLKVSLVDGSSVLLDIPVLVRLKYQISNINTHVFHSSKKYEKIIVK